MADLSDPITNMLLDAYFGSRMSHQPLTPARDSRIVVPLKKAIAREATHEVDA
jgi:hypothetical protein